MAVHAAEIQLETTPTELYDLAKAARNAGKIAELAHKQNYAVIAARSIMRQIGLADVRHEDPPEPLDSARPSYRNKIVEVSKDFEIEKDVTSSAGSVILPAGAGHIEEEIQFGITYSLPYPRLPSVARSADSTGAITVRAPEVWDENDARTPVVHTSHILPNTNLSVNEFCVILFQIANENGYQLPYM